MRIQLTSLVDTFRSFSIVERAGATSDCSTAKDRPPSERKMMSAVVLRARPAMAGTEPVVGSSIVRDMTLRK